MQGVFAILWCSRLSILMSGVRMTPHGPVRQYLGMASGAVIASWFVNLGQTMWECGTQQTWKEAHSPVCVTSRQAVLTHMICTPDARAIA